MTPQTSKRQLSKGAFSMTGRFKGIIQTVNLWYHSTNCATTTAHIKIISVQKLLMTGVKRHAFNFTSHHCAECVSLGSILICSDLLKRKYGPCTSRPLFAVYSL